MKVSYLESPVITRYIEKNKDRSIDDYESTFTNILGDIKKFKSIDANTKLLEIGSGIGWFQLLCKREGIQCKGIEISPQLVNYSYCFGSKYGLVPDIELGNIEDAEIGVGQYDVIIANSVFEHVRDWKSGIANAYRSLKKGGLFYFVSTNKFSIFKSGEGGFVFYGLLPFKLREYLLVLREGEDVRQLGVDFNQFHYFRLKFIFKSCGFTAIHDFTEFLDSESLNINWMKIALKYLRYEPFKTLGVTFAPVTFFICIK